MPLTPAGRRREREGEPVYEDSCYIGQAEMRKERKEVNMLGWRGDGNGVVLVSRRRLGFWF